MGFIIGAARDDASRENLTMSIAIRGRLNSRQSVRVIPKRRNSLVLFQDGYCADRIAGTQYPERATNAAAPQEIISKSLTSVSKSNLRPTRSSAFLSITLFARKGSPLAS